MADIPTRRDGFFHWGGSPVPEDRDGEWGYASRAWSESMGHELIHQFGLPGLSMGIVDLSQGVRTVCYGFDDVDQHKEMRAGRAFRLCSLSKLVTAEIARSAVARDGFSLDAPIGGMVSGLGDEHGLFRNRTARDLLRMTGGVPIDDLAQQASGALSRIAPDEKLDLAQLLPFLTNDRFRADDGSFWYESNSSLILGKILEIATDTPYQNLAKDRLSLPASFRMALSGASRNDEVRYYANEPSDPAIEGKLGRGVLDGAYSSILMSLREGTGGWIANPADFVSYLLGLFHGDTGFRDALRQNAVHLRPGRSYSSGLFQYTDDLLVREAFLPGISGSVAISTSRPVGAFCFANGSAPDKVNVLRMLHSAVVGLVVSTLGDGPGATPWTLR